jgi:hypothetical protein
MLRSNSGPPSGTSKDNTSQIWHNAEYAVAVDQMDDGLGMLWKRAFQHDQRLATPIINRWNPFVIQIRQAPRGYCQKGT